MEKTIEHAIERARAVLEAADWDLDRAAPRVKHWMSDAESNRLHNLRWFLMSLTEPVKVRSWCPGAYRVEWSESNVLMMLDWVRAHRGRMPAGADLI